MPRRRQSFREAAEGSDRAPRAYFIPSPFPGQGMKVAIAATTLLVYDKHGGSHDIDLLGFRWDVCWDGLRGRYYYFSQGYRADTAEKLPRLSSARPGRADVVLNLPGHASVGQGDESRGGQPKDAAMVRRSQVRPLFERSRAEAERHRYHRRVGRWRRRGRRCEACAASHSLAGRWLAD